MKLTRRRGDPATRSALACAPTSAHTSPRQHRRDRRPRRQALLQRPRQRQQRAVGVRPPGVAGERSGRVWRLHYTPQGLQRMERIEEGRVVEAIWRERVADALWRMRYVHERGKRRLTITVRDTTVTEGFDDAIWRRPPAR